MEVEVNGASASSRISFENVTSFETSHDDESDKNKRESSNEETLKSQTLPKEMLSGDKSERTKRTSSLKRSFTLPRNPLNSAKGFTGGSSKSKQSKVMVDSAKSHLARTKSVRKFFDRVISQVASSSNGRQRSKIDTDEEKLKELRKRFENGRVPGVTGIRNHGNTCFMNAILQCLSYTDILAEYLVLDQYKSDLKRKRRIQAFTALHKRNGTKGEVTEQLATVLKSLWSLQYDPEISEKFKTLVHKHAKQFERLHQHDAQEFLLWLLDKVHEDLNTATKRRYKTPKSCNGDRSDEVLAAESLANYLRCNNSFVMDVFQAQFRSSLTCPSCEKQSNTFDPFLCVSLPIPHKELMPVFVTVLYIDQSPRQVKLGLMIGVHETFGDLRQVMSHDTGIPGERIILTEIDDLGFQRTFKDDQPVSLIEKSENLYCIEAPQVREATDDDEENGQYVTLAWVNLLKEGPIEKRFGTPYTLQVSREVLYSDLQKILMKEMAHILHDDILISQQKVPLFKIRIVDAFSTCLDSTVELPLYTEAFDQALNLCALESNGGPVHVKLALEWDAPAKSQIINDDSNPIEEHSSVKQIQQSPEEVSTVTLQECFNLYTQAERLGSGNAWYCPECERKQEVVKRIGLWSAPDVLVIHMKRFRQNTTSANKVFTVVDFPIEGFDMSPNVSNKPPAQNSVVDTTGSGLKALQSAFSPWKHPRRYLPNHRGSDLIYDLYAVCNHHGSDLQGGHYTAYCKNPTDEQWYTFDDLQTKPMSEREVVTQDAYILFYQRRAASASSSASSSSSGSSNNEHWVYRMPNFTFKSKNGTVAPKADSPPTVETNFKRNSGKYATLPAKSSPTKAVAEDVDDKDTESLHEMTISEKNQDDTIARPIDKNDVD